MCSSWDPLLASGLLALLVSGGGSLPVREIAKFYDVAGRTAEDLRSAMNRLGPVGKDGMRFDGYTVWYVRWKYKYEAAATCGLTRLDVTCEVTTTLPRWADQGRATPELRRAWATYLSSLALHEAGHKDIGMRAAAAVRDEVGRLPPEPTCRQLQQAVEVKAQAILDQFRSEEAEYDRTTRHGLTQGARFP